LKKAVIAAALLLIVIMASAGCATYENFAEELDTQGQNDEDTVRIGIFEPLSGVDAEYGKLEKQGIELANELYPTVLGKRVELISEDNKSDPDYSEVAAEKLIKKRASIVLGSYGSSNSLIGGALFEQARIPAVGITCTNPLVTSINEYYFRVCFIDTFQGIAMAKHAIQHDGALTAAIMEENESDYSKTLAQVFKEKFIELTGNPDAIVSLTKYHKGDESFTSQLNAVKSAAPDVVFVPGNPKEAGLIMKEAREAGIKSEFLGISDWETDAFLEYAGSAAEGATFVSPFDADVALTEQTETFIAAYQQKFGRDAVPTKSEALGFDAYIVALEAIEKAGTTQNGDRIRTALTEIRQLPGVTGEITFDANGDAIKPVVIKTIQNGEFVYINTAVPVWE